jgi:hypothetical protein
VPGSKLHVYGGEAQVGTSGGGCSGTTAGAIRYASNTLYYCDATNWQSLGTTGMAVTNVSLGTTTGLTNPHINGDTQTGFYSPSPRTIGIVTNDLERMRIDEDGMVAIGTTTASGKKSLASAG